MSSIFHFVLLNSARLAALENEIGCLSAEHLSPAYQHVAMPPLFNSDLEGPALGVNSSLPRAIHSMVSLQRWLKRLPIRAKSRGVFVNMTTLLGKDYRHQLIFHGPLSYHDMPSNYCIPISLDCNTWSPGDILYTTISLFSCAGSIRVWN